MNIEELKDLVIFELEEKKAENIKVINVAESGIGHYMIFASGRSSKNISAIAESVSTNVKNKTGLKVAIEGFRSGTWVILDIDGIIVHIFHPETRAYYNVEGIFEHTTNKTN